MHDVVIVGGRCAGAPLAMLLARQGHDVLVVERATFPSDTMSTHFIQSPGMARLARWGLMDAVFETNCPPVTIAMFDVDGNEAEFPIPVSAPVTGLASPRRYILDKLLIDAAVAAGATLAEGVLVDSLLRDGDRVVGVRGHSSDGAFEARGRIVVGADGRHSVVAREVEAALEEDAGSITAGYYSYFRDTGVTKTQLFFRAGFVCVMFPTNDGNTCVAIAWANPRFAEIRADIEGNFNAGLRELGPRGEEVLASERAERFVGSADIPNYIRKTHGPGWVLVGDAAYHKDPVPADGISDAFRGADLLADAIHSILSGESNEAAALDAYERVHDQFAAKHFEPALRSANVDLPAQQRLDAFLESRIHDQEELEQVLGETESAPS